MATVELKPIDELFGLNFWVPSYQRGFRWTTTQVKELLEDLYTFVSKRGANENDYYCLQPVIVKPHNDTYELVDGQQRLTALWLISALYYCYTKDDNPNIEREEYTLDYEEKPAFTNIFKTIDELIEDGSIRRLKSELEMHKQDSIDTGNLITNLLFMADFVYDKKTARNIITRIYEDFSHIKVIWYVLDEAEDVIQTFTNINANKIELTNAELIKAVLLCGISNKYYRQSVALQWEEIEKGLNNDSFWNYMASASKKYSTRIDYLFEILCVKNGWKYEDPEDRYVIYRQINEVLSKKEYSPEGLWNELQEIYDTLTDWYKDYFFYHMIGLLVEVDSRKSSEVITELYRFYAQSDKLIFKKKLKSEIRNIYFGENSAKPFTLTTYDDIQMSLDELLYSTEKDKAKIKMVLLLYNILLLVLANNTYEKFPFDLYKKGTWDIEHINPQTPLEGSAEEKKSWLESYKAIIPQQHAELISEIDDCVGNNCSDFDSIAEKVQNTVNVVDNNSITNLVLLDAKTNRGYKNKCFSDKRKIIIEVERTKLSEEDTRYIPIATKWVFLKGYDKASQLYVWGASDMQEYRDDIADKIHIMMGEDTHE